MLEPWQRPTSAMERAQSVLAHSTGFPVLAADITQQGNLSVSLLQVQENTAGPFRSSSVTVWKQASEAATLSS